MIDWDDVDDASWWMLFTNSAGGFIVVLILVGVLAFFAMKNEETCSKKTCPVGHISKLMEHSCMCVIEAK